MRVLLPSDKSAAIGKPVVLAAGFFDGVHIGHQAVIDGAVREARASGAEAWALTFDRHPREIFDPAHAPRLITPTSKRLDLISGRGIDGAYLVHFDSAVAAQRPGDFIRELLGVFPCLRSIRSGANWRFGAGASGSPAFLAALGAELGFTAGIEPDAMFRDEPISSTRIRKAISTGDLASATAMLGRPYAISGEVLPGRQVGSANGVATANFLPPPEWLLPPLGVYAVTSRIDGGVVKGVADLGWRPTFADARPETPVLEVHYLDFNGDLYGKTLEVSFIARLRDEKTFSSSAALFEQIHRDIASARNVLQ